MLETRGEDFPPAFVDALRRALAHYGVRTLDRSPELEESLLWIYKSHQRVEQQIAPVLGVLERRLHRAEASGARRARRIAFERFLTDDLSHTRTLSRAQRSGPRSALSLLRSAACLSGRARQVYNQVEEHLAYLAANPRRRGSHERVAGPGRMSAAAGQSACPAGSPPPIPRCARLMLEAIPRAITASELFSTLALLRRMDIAMLGRIRTRGQAHPRLHHPR